MSAITTIVFDMDGTVLNTLDDLTVSVNYVLNEFGFPERTKEEYRRFFGNGIRYAFRCAVPEEVTEEKIDEMLPLFKEHYDKHCLDKTGPYDGISDLMKELKAQGYKMATRVGRFEGRLEFNMKSRFCSSAIRIMIDDEEIGYVPKEAIYIGDSEVDLKTAQNSGLDCIAVLWGFRDKEFLIENGAAVFAEKPEEIPAILREKFG